MTIFHHLAVNDFNERRYVLLMEILERLLALMMYHRQCQRWALDTKQTCFLVSFGGKLPFHLLIGIFK